jgi:hypothetical protein
LLFSQTPADGSSFAVLEAFVTELESRHLPHHASVPAGEMAVAYLPTTKEKPTGTSRGELLSWLVEHVDIVRSQRVLDEIEQSETGPFLVTTEVPIFGGDPKIPSVAKDHLFIVDLSDAPSDRMASWMRFYIRGMTGGRPSKLKGVGELMMVVRDACSHLGGSLTATARAANVAQLKPGK